MNNAAAERTLEIDDQYIINIDKFILLSIVSFGAYQVWWMYKAWRFFQQKERSDIMPAVRAILSLFFLIALFEKIQHLAKEKGYGFSYSPVVLFIGLLLANLLCYLPEPYWMLTMISVVFFFSPFEALNFAKRHSTDFVVIEQTKFSGRQIALIVVGTIWWALLLISVFLG
ncbi:hypothetical protein [Olivibacter sitiensis]|uniref:hypothetical protein n=1 Tax=Olivibacter sitiensis TaxID=376470 RepID=UPI00056423A7|nr:hypothetical protein [Olivibacter sitiensis]